MIFPTQARLLIKEHLYKRISGRMLVLGRQTIRMSYIEAVKLFVEEGYVPKMAADISNDRETCFHQIYPGVSDKTFFGMFGIEKLDFMDVSEYEGANIIHDLNYPVPRSLVDRFDFIIDAGVFDHMFDIRMAFENIVMMLKCGGRIIHWNAASNFSGAAYLSFGPDFFKDFYVFNKFKDCKAYIVEEDEVDQPDGWDFYELEYTDKTTHFRSFRMQMLIVLAEKGVESTHNVIPIQRQYRNASSQKQYISLEGKISLSKRPSLSGIKLPVLVNNFKGLKYVGRI